jgi:hypothetical protein
MIPRASSDPELLHVAGLVETLLAQEHAQLSWNNATMKASCLMFSVRDLEISANTFKR